MRTVSRPGHVLPCPEDAARVLDAALAALVPWLAAVTR